MNQLDAFDHLNVFPRAHTNDPRSSHEAADKMERSGAAKLHAERVLATLKRWPQSTSAELAPKVQGLDLTEVRRRLTDLLTANLVERIDPTDEAVPCAISGKRVCRWRPL